MRWVRRGLVFTDDGSRPWARSHASTPVALVRADGMLDLYYTSRDAENRSHIGVVVVDPADVPWNVVERPRLLLGPGPPGRFDDRGVSLGSVETVRGETVLYYMGWNLRPGVPFRNQIGVARRSGSDAPFVRLPEPILPISPVDPCSLSYPWIVPSSDSGDRSVVFYGSCERWGPTVRESDFVIRRATSIDGRWVPQRAPDVVPVDDEYAIARPCVWTSGSGWSMALAARRASAPDSYELAGATSPDGTTWRRCRFALEGRVEPWESEMQCYPSRFVRDGREYLLYNGNRFGATGVGLAERIT